MKVVIANLAPLLARRLLEQQRQEGAVGQPQRQQARQCRQQPGLSFLPELDEHGVVESTPIMDQTFRPVRLGLSPIDKPQGARSAGRPVRGCNRADSSPGGRLFHFAG